MWRGSLLFLLFSPSLSSRKVGVCDIFKSSSIRWHTSDKKNTCPQNCFLLSHAVFQEVFEKASSSSMEVCVQWMIFFLYFRKQWSITLGGPRWRPLNPPKLAVFATSFTDLAYLSLLPFSLAKADKVPYNVTPPPSPKLLLPPPVGAWCYQTSGI